MALTVDMLKKIKEEIDKDPEHLGYSGKTNSEIATMLSNNYTKQRIVEDVFQSPISRILSYMANTPNIISATEVSQAKITT